MLKLFHRKKDRTNRYPGKVYATQDGTAVSLQEVPDDVIRNNLLGIGVAIIPKSGKVVAPVDGMVTAIANTKHAYCIKTSDGLEVIIHIGVDTVALQGKGFNALVEKGDYVLAGELICEVDLDYLAENKVPCHTAILISNHEELKKIDFSLGEVQAGSSIIAQYD